MHAGEPFRRDADDGELDGVEADLAADDVRPPAELPLPHPVTEDHDRVAARHLIVVGSEAATERRLDSQRGEEVAVDEKADRDARLFLAPLRESKDRVLRGGQPLERLRAPLDLVGFRVGEAADRTALRQRREADHAIRFGDRKRTQQK